MTTPSTTTDAVRQFEVLYGDGDLFRPDALTLTVYAHSARSQRVTVVGEDAVALIALLSKYEVRA